VTDVGIGCPTHSGIGKHQGCSVRFFGSRGLVKFVKVLEPSFEQFELLKKFEQFDALFPKWRILMVSVVVLLVVP
jgi:hypothetical protein